MNLVAHRDALVELLRDVAEGIDVQSRTYEELEQDGSLNDEGICVALIDCDIKPGTDNLQWPSLTLRWSVDVWAEQSDPETRALELLASALSVIAGASVEGDGIELTGFSREGAETQSTCRYKITFEYQTTEAF